MFKFIAFALCLGLIVFFTYTFWPALKMVIGIYPEDKGDED